MSCAPSYRTSIKKSGISTPMVDEPMTNTVGNSYKIDDSLKEIWNRDVFPTFEESAISISVSDIQSIDYLAGTVTFLTPKTGAITVSGEYYPMANVAGANAYTLDISAETQDSTEFSGDGYREKQSGLLDVSLSVTAWEKSTTDFYSLINNRIPFVVEVTPGGESLLCRGWFICESNSKSGSVEALESNDVSFQLDGDWRSSFSFIQ